MNNNKLSLTGSRFSSSSSLSGGLSRVLEQSSGSIQRQTTRALERVVSEGVIENTCEEIRAALTNTALQNVGALSTLEEHLTLIAPSGADRYRHIVDAYTVGAAQRVARW